MWNYLFRSVLCVIWIYMAMHGIKQILLYVGNITMIGCPELRWNYDMQKKMYNVNDIVRGAEGDVEKNLSKIICFTSPIIAYYNSAKGIVAVNLLDFISLFLFHIHVSWSSNTKSYMTCMYRFSM